jgi:hypothetical protein
VYFRVSPEKSCETVAVMILSDTQTLWPHAPWVQPSLFEADCFIAVCGCGWSSEPRDSIPHAKLSAFAHLDDVREWVKVQEGRL